MPHPSASVTMASLTAELALQSRVMPADAILTGPCRIDDDPRFVLGEKPVAKRRYQARPFLARSWIQAEREIRQIEDHTVRIGKREDLRRHAFAYRQFENGGSPDRRSDAHRAHRPRSADVLRKTLKHRPTRAARTFHKTFFGPAHCPIAPLRHRNRPISDTR